MGMRHPRPVTSQTTITSTFHMWDSHDHQNGGLPTVGASRNEGQNIGVYFCDMLNCFVQETGQKMESVSFMQFQSILICMKRQNSFSVLPLSLNNSLRRYSGPSLPTHSAQNVNILFSPRLNLLLVCLLAFPPPSSVSQGNYILGGIILYNNH